MRTLRISRTTDWYLLAITLVICAFGILQIYSATHATKWEDAWWKQVVFVAGGLVLMWVVTQIDYHALLGQVFPLYGLSIALLLITMMVGNKVFGSTRWIRVAGFTLQVSEFVKIVIILLVARVLSDLKAGQKLEWRDLAKLCALVGVPMLLVMKEPDLGTSLTYIPILVCGIFMAGWREKYLLIVATALLI